MLTSTNAFVRKIRGYGLLSDGEVRRLIEATDPPRKVRANRDLIREGDKPSSLFVILEGWACRYKVLPDGSRQIIAFLIPGDFCDVHVGELEETGYSEATTRSRLRTLVRTHWGHLTFFSNVGPPTWWRPKAEVKRYSVMVGWLRAAYVLSWHPDAQTTPTHDGSNA